MQLSRKDVQKLAAPNKSIKKLCYDQGANKVQKSSRPNRGYIVPGKKTN